MAKKNQPLIKRKLLSVFIFLLFFSFLILSVSWPKRNLVNEWQEKKRLEREINAWEKILEKHPGFRDAHLHLAVLYWQIKNNTTAQEHLKRAKTLDPNFAQTHELEQILKDTRDLTNTLIDY